LFAHELTSYAIPRSVTSCSRLFDQRRNLPKRVEVRDLNERTLVKLATERKHLTDIIKMVAYLAESDLIGLLRPHYARVDQEDRALLRGTLLHGTLLHELFATAGDNIHVADGGRILAEVIC
jgi:hypothetical protein